MTEEEEKELFRKWMEADDKRYSVFGKEHNIRPINLADIISTGLKNQWWKDEEH